MAIEPLGRRISVYQGVRGWVAAYFITDAAPTREAAQLAADAFTSPYSAGYRDGLRDLWQLWIEYKAWAGEKWSVERITDWLRGAVGRLAPGVAGGA